MWVAERRALSLTAAKSKLEDGSDDPQHRLTPFCRFSPVRQFDYMWTVLPTASESLLRYEATRRGQEDSFAYLHWYIDEGLLWRATQNYGFNSSTASYSALSARGSFEAGDEWRYTSDDQPDFFACAYVQLWLMDRNITRESLYNEEWKRHQPGLDVPFGCDVGWDVSEEDHVAIVQAAALVNEKDWPFKAHRQRDGTWIAQKAGEFYLRNFDDYHADDLIPPPDDPTAEAAYNTALHNISTSWPWWLPARIFFSPLTPEIAWDPHGATTREKQASLLSCVTRMDLEVTPGVAVVYELAPHIQPGSVDAFEHYKQWCIEVDLESNAQREYEMLRKPRPGWGGRMEVVLKDSPPWSTDQPISLETPNRQEMIAIRTSRPTTYCVL